MPPRDGMALDQSYLLERLSPGELAELYALVRAQVRHYHPTRDDIEPLARDTPEYDAALDQLSQIEFEYWGRLSPWVLAVRSALEESLAAAAAGQADVHVVPHVLYPGLPASPQALGGFTREDPLAAMALVGFTLRVRPLSPSTSEQLPWSEVFLGGVDALTGDVYDHRDYQRQRHERRDWVLEPGLQEPDLWPDLLVGGPRVVFSRVKDLARLLGGEFAQFGASVTQEVIEGIIEAAVQGPPPSWAESPQEAQAYQHFRMLLDAVYTAAERQALVPGEPSTDEPETDEPDGVGSDGANSDGVDSDGDDLEEAGGRAEEICLPDDDEFTDPTAGADSDAGAPADVTPASEEVAGPTHEATEESGEPAQPPPSAGDTPAPPPLPDDEEGAEEICLPDDDEFSDPTAGADSDAGAPADVTPASEQGLEEGWDGSEEGDAGAGAAVGDPGGSSAG